MEARELWQGLQQDFTEMNKAELQAVLCRAQHFQIGDVKYLRPHEERVMDWLGERGVKPSKVFQWVLRQKQSKYAERYTAKRQEEKWRRLIDFKTEMGRVLPDRTPEELRLLVRRVARWEYGEIKMLSSEEFMLRDVILRFNIKSSTLYQWLIETVIPEEFQHKIDQGLLSVYTAKRLFLNRERQRKAACEVRLLEDAQRIVQEVFV